MAGVVIDASVAVKWFLAEDRAAETRRYRDVDAALVAPASVLLEVFHALWKSARGDRISFDAVEEAALILRHSYSVLVPIHELFEPAAALAVKLRFPIYDCLYLALGARESAEIVTADERMFAAAREAGLKPHLL